MANLTMLGTGLIGGVLHADAPRAEEPRPGRQRLFAVGGEGAGVRGGARDPALDRGPAEGRARSGIGDRRRRAAQQHPRARPSSSPPRPARPSCAPSLSAGRPPRRSKMLRAVEKAGVFAGYLEDLVYTPKTLKALASTRKGAMGRILWTRSRETHPGPHSAWFWDPERSGGGAIIDMGCHCIEIGRNFIGKDKRPAPGLLLGRDPGPPDRGRGSRHRARRVRGRRGQPVRGQLDVPRRHGPARRGQRHRGDDPPRSLPAHGLRDVHGRGRRRVRRREGRRPDGLALPGRRRGPRARLRPHVPGHARRAGSRASADGDVLRRLRRQRHHRRMLPVDDIGPVGAGETG
ncbi:MAG: hypothetical protein MZU79_06075 [Anaerotruncus sp.]|nr:hypothetical protein [Anaerotruncus sp.]